MSEDDPAGVDYPNTVDDPEGGDLLVKVLREWDDEHFKKAVALVLAARTEWVYSQEAGEKEVYHDDFQEFADHVVEIYDENDWPVDLDEE